jgi:hypothetical protein
VRAVVANRVALGDGLEGKQASAEDLVVLEPDILFDAVYADCVCIIFPPGGKMTQYSQHRKRISGGHSSVVTGLRTGDPEWRLGLPQLSGLSG